MPKWIHNHPERQAYVEELWNIYGLRCNQGHYLCRDASHYVKIEQKVVLEPRKQRDVKYVDSNGKPILDRFGHPCTRKVQEVKKTIVTKTYLRTVEFGNDGGERLACTYDYKFRDLKAIWIQADRSETVSKYQAEYELRHKQLQRYIGIARDCYYDTLAVYTVDCFGIDGITFKPFVKIHINTTGTVIFIDLAEALSGKSVNAKRKIIRYGNNGKIDNDVDYAIYKAVRKYLG